MVMPVAMFDTHNSIVFWGLKILTFVPYARFYAIQKITVLNTYISLIKRYFMIQARIKSKASNYFHRI